ncbi:YdeI/OmpD-associated family protein [Enterococcus olivae]
MNLKTIVTPANREELRNWLSTNATSSKECWVVINKDNLNYLDIVEEALCFGWIDSTKKKISETETAQRISPRRKNSNWTELNKERVRRLRTLGLMTDQGENVLPDMAISRFKVIADIESKINSHPEIKQNYEAFPELYKRIRIDTIQSYYKDKNIYDRRLKKFLENTEKGIMYGAWHDNGRLLNDD